MRSAIILAAAMATGAAMFVAASLAWELHLFSRHGPPQFHTEGTQ